MKHDHINYLMVGGLVITMLILLVVVVLRLSGQNVETESYYVVYSDISGVKEGTAVTFGGYTIGQVSEIAPVRQNGKTQFKLNLLVNEDWRLPSDSVARVASPGLLSDKVIDIVEGSSGELLPPLSILRGQESADLFTAVDEVAFEIKDLSENSIRPMLQQFSNSIQTISKRIDKIGGELDAGIPNMITNADRFLVELNRNIDQVSKLLNKTNQQHIGNLVANFDSMSGNLLKVSQQLDNTVNQFDGLIKSSNNVIVANDKDIRKSIVDLRKSLNIISQNIDSIVYNLDTTSRNFNEFSRQIRMNPGLLLGGSSPKDPGEGKN